jgi:hypothetical protein
MGVSAAMERRDYLKAQAALLRGVAETFDIKSIKDRVLAQEHQRQSIGAGR